MLHIYMYALGSLVANRLRTKSAIPVRAQMNCDQKV